MEKLKKLIPKLKSKKVLIPVGIFLGLGIIASLFDDDDYGSGYYYTAPPSSNMSHAPSTSGTNQAPSTSGGVAQQASSGLTVVRFPPSERALCHLCDGTMEGTCMLCLGSGRVTGEIHNAGLYASFGLGGLATTLNNLSCTACWGTGVGACFFGLCDGTMPNPEYRAYAMGLKALSDQTGVRIFELESNQVSRFIALDFCTMCEGLGWFPHLKIHDTDMQLCYKCYAQGMKLSFIDSFTQEELTRSYDNYLSLPDVSPASLPPVEAVWTLPGMRVSAPTYGSTDTNLCIQYPHCRSSRQPNSNFCRDCRP